MERWVAVDDESSGDADLEQRVVGEDEEEGERSLVGSPRRWG